MLFSSFFLAFVFVGFLWFVACFLALFGCWLWFFIFYLFLYITIFEGQAHDACFSFHFYLNLIFHSDFKVTIVTNNYKITFILRLLWQRYIRINLIFIIITIGIFFRIFLFIFFDIIKQFLN